jgi:hypothetical protein
LVNLTHFLTHKEKYVTIIELFQCLIYRLKELKILREQSRAGSIPATRTIFPRGNVLTGIMHETSNLE